jgi:alpha-mannosidase
VYRDAAVFQAPLYLRRGDETEGYLPDEVWRDNSPDALLAPARLKPQYLTGELPAELSFLSIEPDALVLSAVKRSEDGTTLVVRCYNPTAELLQAVMRLYRPIRSAQTLNLNEEPLSELPVVGSREIAFTVGGKQVHAIGIAF